jgi:hypothetical protein
MSQMIGKGRSWTVSRVSLLAIGALALGCGGNSGPHTGKHDIWFMGAVIDGASGLPLTTYEISLIWGTNSVKGKVDASGRYTMGPLPAWNDYGVIISSNGYRVFSSYNAGIAPPAPGSTSLSADVYTADTTQTFNFDASLFPSTLVPASVSITVLEMGNTTPNMAAGKIRLQPTSQPPLQSTQTQQTEIQGQVWTNDADLYAGAISADFTGGVYAVPGSMLTYGVTYSVNVYNVDGYQPSMPLNVQAGVTTGTSITLMPLTVAPLVLVAKTVTTCHAPANLTDATSAVVTLTFQENVEDGTLTLGGGAEQLDNGVGFSDTMFNSTLAPSLSSTMQEHGVTLTFADNVATIAWNPNVGLATKGPSDVIRTVTYSANSLSATSLQPVKHPELRVSLATLLANVVGQFSPITCAAP